ncbi:MAG: HAMP domain-containing sensor histidine kinase [Polyangiaceae bacterium]|nr:HAMP domain-containing sensor histidine kinase [Polyangiaceae bacterium]
MAERTQERLLTFFLLPVIVLAELVLMGVMFRSSFQLEKLRSQSVLEATLALANERADRLDKRIIEQDNAVKSLIDVSRRQDLGDSWLEVADIQTPTIRAVLLVDLTAPGREVVAFASRAPGLEDEHFRRLLVGSMLGDMKLGEPNGDELRHLHKSYEGQSYLVSHWERSINGRRYMVVLWHDVPRVIHELFPSLYPESDQQSRVNVVDADGRIIYGPPLSRGGLTLGRQFETTLYKWRLNVTMNSAEELGAAVARRRIVEVALLSLSGLVVIAGVIVILVAAARERNLSNLKSDFVANVSHELKTPLSLVRMFGELLQSGRVESDEKRDQYLRIIVNESERLGALIENVLDFAKVERGKAAYDFTPCAPADAVLRAVDACRLRAEQESVVIELDIPEGLPLVELDERAIEIAVINLIDNALKYAAAGKKVTVSVREVGAFIEVRVKDRGRGILPDERKRIFDRFVRGKDASERRTRGSGIGLALVKHIAEAHGGKAWVEEAAPSGSVFCFTLSARLRGETRTPPNVAPAS